MRELLLKILILLAPIAIAVAGFNYWVDPRGLFHDEHPETTIAELLLNNKTAVFPSDFDEYQFNRQFIPKLPAAPKVIALGSSRTMLIRRQHVGTDSFVNSAVSSAKLADLLVTYEIYVECNRTPSMVIIGLDTWILSRIPASERRPEFLQMLTRLGGSTAKSSSPEPVVRQFRPPFEALLSLSYLNASMRDVLRMRRTVAPFGINSGDEDRWRASAPIMKYPDGSWEYPLALRTCDVAHTRLAATEYSKTYADAEFALKDADPESMRIFEKFIDLLLRDQRKVLFFLPSYHPITYSALKDLFTEKEAFYRRVASERNIQVVGSYDPSASNLSEQDFYDAGHMKPSGIAKIFDSQQTISHQDP